jgi:hypothetical protein
LDPFPGGDDDTWFLSKTIERRQSPNTWSPVGRLTAAVAGPDEIHCCRHPKTGKT